MLQIYCLHRAVGLQQLGNRDSVWFILIVSAHCMQLGESSEMAATLPDSHFEKNFKAQNV